MARETRLRILRLKYGISFRELSGKAGISPQRLYQLEVENTENSMQQEERMNTALCALIEARKADIENLERDYLACKGRLFELTEAPYE